MFCSFFLHSLWTVFNTCHRDADLSRPGRHKKIRRAPDSGWNRKIYAQKRHSRTQKRAGIQTSAQQVLGWILRCFPGEKSAGEKGTQQQGNGSCTDPQALCWNHKIPGSFHRRPGNVSGNRLFAGPVPESRTLRHVLCRTKIQTGIGERRTELFVFLCTSGDSETVHVLFPLSLCQSQNWKDFLFHASVWERFPRERLYSVSEARR